MRQTDMTAQDRAERSAEIMLAKDLATRALGIHLDHVAPGQATMSLRIEPDHLNGHGICHGGVIYTLADTAFAVACNSYNTVVVAQHNTITYVRPGRAGATLSAHATEVALSGRSGTYDVRITDERGDVIALFRGQSRQMSSHHFSEDPP